MPRKNGLTLIELLVVIAILAIISSIIMVIINPLEIIRRTRDSSRLLDLANLQLAIHVLIQENQGSPLGLLCEPPAYPPCSGSSTDPGGETRKTDGTGWVKIALSANGPISAPTLPVDPINSGILIYTYAVNREGNKWELNAVMESDREKVRMEQDGGNNPNKYEVGLDLNILN